MWKANGKTVTLVLFLDSLFPKTEIYARCFLWRQNNSYLWGGVFLLEISCSRRYSKKDYKEKKKENHSYKIGTWSVRTLNRGGKLENLEKEMQKNEVSVLGVNEVRWKEQGEIRSGDYTVYYTVYNAEGERAGKGVARVVLESIVRSVVRRTVCNAESLLLNYRQNR